MRRLFTLAAFLLTLSLISASAQRGGAHAGFGGHGAGRGGSFGGHAFGGHDFGGVHSGSGFKFGGGSFVRSHNHGFDHCWGCRARFGFPGYAGYGFRYAGFYDPFWLSNSYSSYDYDPEREQAMASQQNALNLQEQNLREREDWLREREERYENTRQAPAREPEPAKPSPSTVLVFRDQHQQEITNYAISGNTLWILNDHLVAKKIPLTDLDLAATAKANDERGVEFQVPK